MSPETMSYADALKAARQFPKDWRFDECTLAGLRLQRHLELTPSLQCVISADTICGGFKVQFTKPDMEQTGGSSGLPPHQNILTLDVKGHSMADLDPSKVAQTTRRIWRRMFIQIVVAALCGYHVRMGILNNKFGAVIETEPFTDELLERPTLLSAIRKAVNVFHGEQELLATL